MAGLDLGGHSIRVLRTGPIFDPATVLETARKIDGALWAMALQAEKIAKQNTPTGATNATKNSIKSGRSGDLEYTVSSDGPASAFVETGSRPHFPWDRSATAPTASGRATRAASNYNRARQADRLHALERPTRPKVEGWFPESFVMWVNRKLQISDPAQQVAALWAIARKMKAAGTSINAASRTQYGVSPGAGGYWPMAAAAEQVKAEAGHGIAKLGLEIVNGLGGAQ